MDEYLHLNLIHLFTFYLTAMFIISTFRRIQQYRDVTQLAMDMPGRWPNVLQNIKKHSLMFFTWATLRPAGLALFLIAVQMVCSRVIWPKANISAIDLCSEWWMIPILGLAGLAMIAIDFYFILYVGSIDRKETEKYLDEAEHWLSSWKTPVIRVVTLGIVNPRRIVDSEVRKAMAEGQGLLNQALWWVSLQAALRLLFGLALWIAWAVHPNLGGSLEVSLG